jgi:hypothetical protein
MTGPIAPAVSFPASRRMGRPRVSREETTSVSTRLGVSEYDRLWKIANARNMSVAGILRDMARRARLPKS